MPSWIFSARAAAVPEASASDEKEVELKSGDRNFEKMGSDAMVSRSVVVESGCCVVVVGGCLKVVERWIVGDAIVGLYCFPVRVWEINQ